LPPKAGPVSPRIIRADRTSCSKATANQFRLLIHTAAYWLMHGLRALAPKRLGTKATESISIFAFSNSPTTCTAVLVGGLSGTNSPRMREKTA
jgi:hypothetical protein